MGNGPRLRAPASAKDAGASASPLWQYREWQATAGIDMEVPSWGSPIYTTPTLITLPLRHPPTLSLMDIPSCPLTHCFHCYSPL